MTALLRRDRAVAPPPRPIWFGAAQRPLAGFLHEPRDPPRGAVVICPPFGYEHTCSHRTLRTLGDHLASRGIVALRFDYEGTGASSGRGDAPDQLDRWRQSVREAVDEMRGRGFESVALFGLRLGGALALEVGGSTPCVHAVATWVPVTDGSRYARELRAQSAVSPGGLRGDGSLNVMGHLLEARVVSAIKQWRPVEGVRSGLPVLTVTSPAWRTNAELVADLQRADVELEVRTVPGTPEVLETAAELVRVPVPLIREIGDWLAARATADVLTVEPARAHQDAVRRFDDGDGPITESLERLEPFGNHAVIAAPGGAEPSGEAFVFWNNGVATSDGPGRAWTQFARRFAATGATTMRFDLTGLGNSPDTETSIATEEPLARNAGSQLIAAVELLRARGASRITAVGLCSGAQLGIRTVSHTPAIDRVFAINPALYAPRDIGVGPPVRRVWHVSSLVMAKDKIRRVLYLLPRLTWRLADRVGLYPLPSRLVDDAAPTASVHIIYADQDKGLVDIQTRDPALLDRRNASGEAIVEAIEGLDHSMFSLEHREQIVNRIIGGPPADRPG